MTLECAWSRRQLGSGFLCDLGQVTFSLAATFSCAQVSCTWRWVARPNRAGLDLGPRKMLGCGCWAQGGLGSDWEPRLGDWTEVLG